jgi:ribonucleoside-diphosphate reductase alpha chain
MEARGRQPLPDTRRSINRKFKIPYLDEQEQRQVLKLYVIVGFYDDGKIGEVFIHADRVGSFLSGALDTIAMIMSVGLQHGVPVSDITAKLRSQRFGPSGLTGDKDFRSCTSPFDLVAQYLDSIENKRLAEANPNPA